MESSKMKGCLDYDSVFTSFGGKTLFFIERSIDSRIIVYEACRKDKKLVSPLVTVNWSDLKHLDQRQDVEKKLQDLLFGVKVQKVVNEVGKYNMVLNGLPERLIVIQLKKNGNCVAKTILNGKSCKLIKVYTSMTNSTIPSVLGFDVYGHHKNEIIKEFIPVDDEMRKKFNYKNFIPSLRDFGLLL